MEGRLGWCNLMFGLSLFFLVSVGTAQEKSQTDSDASKSVLWTRDGLDWPEFLGLANNGTSAEQGLIMARDGVAPSTVWAIRTGQGYGVGSVANGRYFHFDRVRDEARLRAFEAETGKEIWQFKYPTAYRDLYGFDEGPRSSPVVDGDRVYVHGVEGMLVCLEAESGDKVWEVDTAKKFGVKQNFFGVGSTPTIFKDLLIVMIGGSPEESQSIPAGRLDEVKPNGNAIVAFNKFTGEIRYQTIDDLASYASPIVAEVDGKMTGVALCRSGLFGFDPDSGKQLFDLPYRARKFESVNAATPLVIEGQILLTESYGIGGALVGIAAQKPEVVWADGRLRDSVLACHWSTPVVVDGFIYASSGEKRSTASLNCIRLSDGELMWRQPGLSRSSLTYVSGHLICLTEEGQLIVIKPNSDRFEKVDEWSGRDLGLIFPCWAAPIVSHGLLFIVGKSRVVCLDLAKE